MEHALTILTYLLGTVVIIHVVRQVLRARKQYLQTKAEKENKHYNHQAEIEEALSMYENNQESG